MFLMARKSGVYLTHVCRVLPATKPGEGAHIAHRRLVSTDTAISLVDLMEAYRREAMI